MTAIVVTAALTEDERVQFDYLDAIVERTAARIKEEMFHVKVDADAISFNILAALKRKWESTGWVVGAFPDGRSVLVVFARSRAPAAPLPPRRSRESIARASAVSPRSPRTTTPLLLRMPTRGRPRQALSVLAAYRDLAIDPIEIEVVIDEDDSEMLGAVVLQRLRDLDCVITVGRHGSKIAAVNGGRVDDWAILALISDDMVPVARGYDRRIIAAMDAHFPLRDGAVYFNDGHNRDHACPGFPALCTLPIMGRHLHDQFGYVYFPSYGSLYCDDEQTRVLTAMRRLAFVDELIIEHRHHATGKAPCDALYRHNDDTHGVADRQLFEERQARGFDAPPLSLSILICSVAERAASLRRLEEHLRAQMRRLPRRVELLVDDDGRMTVGEKRQRLLDRAVGQYVAHVDDDDFVAHDYCDRIVAAIDANPGVDCLSLAGTMTTGGAEPRAFLHSISCDGWSDDGDVLRRTPNHLNAVRRDLALQVGFASKSVGEDFDFSRRLRPLLRTEASTGDAPLYYYFYDAARSVQSVRQRGRFTVVVADLESKPHNECFREFADALAGALRDLGHDVASSSDPRPGRLILLGANDDTVRDLPADAIIYNAEPIAVAADPRRLIAGVDRVVWDYSESNVARWRALGVARAVHCPVGYHSSMAKIASAEEDIDVLFYGWMSERRLEILRALEAAGARVVGVAGKYGVERDRLIARSKVVLNLHYSDEAIFEIFRVSHLLANGKCVVTEAGGVDEGLEKLAKETCARVPWDEIVRECLRLLGQDAVRQSRAELGRERFRETSLVENVRRALEQS